MEKLLYRYKNKLNHAQRRLDSLKEKLEGKNPSEVFSYHGGWSVGYWESKIAVLEDIIDDLEELI